MTSTEHAVKRILNSGCPYTTVIESCLCSLQTIPSPSAIDVSMADKAEGNTLSFLHGMEKGLANFECY